MPHFECGTFNHSATSPCAMEPEPCFWKNAVSIGCAAISMRRGAIQGALRAPQEIVKAGLDHRAHTAQKLLPDLAKMLPAVVHRVVSAENSLHFAARCSSFFRIIFNPAEFNR